MRLFTIVFVVFVFSLEAFAGSPLEAYKKNRCAQDAMDSNRKNLIVAFDGLFSHNSRMAKVIYENQVRAENNQKLKVLRGFGGYMAKGLLNNLVTNEPELADVILLSQTTSGNLAPLIRCIVQWRRVKGPNFPIILTGHSNGGDTAMRLAVQLDKLNIQIQGLLTIDALPKLATYWSKFHMLNFQERLENVEYHINVHIGGNSRANLTFADENIRVNTSHIYAPMSSAAYEGLLELLDR